MRHLCDSNVLLAAIQERHPHHKSALEWLDGLDDGETVALCRHTQISFLRLLTTEAAMREDVQTNAKAIKVLSDFMEDPRFEYIIEEPIRMEDGWPKWAAVKSESPKLWMDAYLAAFAHGHSLRLVTFDKAFARFRATGLDLLILS